jgi:hypothetical protein
MGADKISLPKLTFLLFCVVSVLSQATIIDQNDNTLDHNAPVSNNDPNDVVNDDSNSLDDNS